MQYLNTIRPSSGSGDNISGHFRDLIPAHDGDASSFYGKAHVFEDNKGIVSRLFSYGISVAQIEATSNGDKIIVLDYRKLIKDNSPAKSRWETVFRHVREFLHEHGYSVETNDDLVPFLAQEETSSPAPIEAKVAHWVRNEHPRKPEEAWYTCSHCGKLAVADGGKDILTDCCPHCGFDMKREEKVKITRASAKKVGITHPSDKKRWVSGTTWLKEEHAEMKLAPGSYRIITEFRHADSKEKLYPLVKVSDGKWYQLRKPTRDKIAYIVKHGGFFRLVPFGNMTEEEKNLYYEDVVTNSKYSKKIFTRRS